MIRPKNDTEDLLVSITKNCEKLVKQTHRKAEENLELKLAKPRGIIHFNPPLSIEGYWTIGLVDLQVYKSFFNITDKNKKFELYRFTDEKFGGVSYEKVRDEIVRKRFGNFRY